MSGSEPVQVVSVSGGKDSTATALLALERGHKPVFVFADTGNEHEQTYEYLRYLETQIGPITWVRASFERQMAGKRAFVEKHWADHGVPAERIERALAVLQPSGNPFLDLCIWKGRFPSRRAQFCTHELKVDPINEQVIFPLLSEGCDLVSWQGVRADESAARRHLPESEPMDPAGTIYRPILTWTAEQVFNYILSHGVEVNPLYRQGMGRVGCMPCINCGKGEMREIAQRFPEVIDRIREWEALVSDASKRGASTFFYAGGTSDEVVAVETVLQTHGIDARVKWSRTTRGGAPVRPAARGRAHAMRQRVRAVRMSTTRRPKRHYRHWQPRRSAARNRADVRHPAGLASRIVSGQVWAEVPR